MKFPVYFLICLLFVGSILSAGCSSSDSDERKSSNYNTPIRTAVTTELPQSPSKNLDRSIDLANKIIPTSIPGFSLKTKAKDPNSGMNWGDEYILHSYWVPKTDSNYASSIDSLIIDVYIYENSNKANEWYTGVWKKLSDSPIQIENKNGDYRYDFGEATVTFQQDNLIVVINALYDMQPPEYYHNEGITKEAALEAAKQVVDNLN